MINDGGDVETRNLITQSKLSCCIQYLEMPHPDSGFGLCHARNLGMAIAKGDLVAYLDDDNTIEPTFVSAVQQFFHQHPQIQCSLVQQWRRRDQVSGNHLVRSGHPFVSPDATATVENLLTQRALFDSNGFTHRRNAALRWNPEYRVFADYEFFLQCLNVWGRDCFQLHPLVLVNYVQRSDGVIGQSSYGEWAIELEQILDSRSAYPVIDEQIRTELRQLVQRWHDRSERHIPIAAFSNQS